MLKRMVLCSLIKLSFHAPIFNYVANKTLKYQIIKTATRIVQQSIYMAHILISDFTESKARAVPLFLARHWIDLNTLFLIYL